MKSALISMCNIAFVLVVLSINLFQTVNNYSQQSEKFYLLSETVVKPEIKENHPAVSTRLLLSQEDNARKLLITEGSSSTEGYGVTNEYPKQLAALFSGNYYKQAVSLILDSSNLWTVRNVGNGGDTMIQMTAQYATQVLPFYNSSRIVNYLTLQGGSNDIANGRTTAALKADVAAYVARAKADGFVVGVCTIFHRVGNDVGKVNDYNNWLRAGNSGADFVIDLAAHPNLSDATNLMYFQGDGIHTNNAGQTVIASIFADAIPVIEIAPVLATVSGRVLSAKGKGISNIALTLTDEAGTTRTTRSDLFGAYNFISVPVGKTYVVRAIGSRYTFIQPTLVLNVNDDVNEVNFIASPRSKF